MIDTFTFLAEFLQTSGGWGIAALSIWALYKKDQQFSKKMDERHEEVLVLLRETSELLGSVRQVLEQCHNHVNNQDWNG